MKKTEQELMKALSEIYENDISNERAQKTLEKYQKKVLAEVVLDLLNRVHGCWDFVLTFKY